MTEKNLNLATSALRLVVAYDDLMRRYTGPVSDLTKADNAAIDEAYDQMVAAARITLDVTDRAASPAPEKHLLGEQVDYPKILYVCETCWEGNSEACGSDRDRINITPDGRWLCEDCRDGEDIDASLCRQAPKLYTAPARSQHLRTACEGIADDYMTSEHHHPGYVLIPTAKFEEIRAALGTTEGQDNG